MARPVTGSFTAGAEEAHGIDAALRERLDRVCDEGRALWNRFDVEVSRKQWHPFVPAETGPLLQALSGLRDEGRRFLEWGSGMGVITIMADLLGFEACGIELDADLVGISRDLALRAGSKARFAAGSFVPEGYEWKPEGGDGRMGTIGAGVAAYEELGSPLESFDLVYVFPWPGEEPLMLDIMGRRGRAGARLLMNGSSRGLELYRDGRREA